MGRLTVTGVRSKKAGRHADGDGLYLLVKPSGARSWVLRVQHQGRRRDIGLGAVRLDSGRADGENAGDESAVPLLHRKLLSLAEAREKAALLRRLALAGRDPVLERDREKRRIPTFAEAVKEAHAELGKGWVPKHAAAFLSSLEAHIVPVMGAQRVDHIDHAAVRDSLAPIWTEKPAMAQKLRVRIGQVLSFAKAKGWRKDAAPDPRAVRTGLARPVRGGNLAAMPWQSIPAFVQSLTTGADTSGRLALLLAVFTAARSGEVRAAKWDQVDLEAGTWTRPAAIMKTKVEHVVMLNEAARAILKRAEVLQDRSGLIFPGKGGAMISDMTMTKALRTAGHANVTVHGFRSSFRDWAAERMPTMPPMVAEMALAHSVGTKTERAYLRSDLQVLRSTLMTAWGDYCTAVPAGNVTPIREAEAG